MKCKSMKTKYLAIVALALDMVACEQAANNVEIPADNRMLFDVASPSAHTRVSNGAFEAEDRIGVYVTDYADDTTPMPLQISGNRANNEALLFDGASWAPERAIYWGEGKSDVYAYYPYMEVEDVDEQPFSVALDQDTDGAYEASDLLWAKAEGVAQADGAVSLAMNHSMSRLVVKIMAGEEYVGSLPEDATVHLHSTVTDAHISLANGSVVKNPYSGAKSIKMKKLGLRTYEGVQAVVYEAIVVPQMLGSSVPLLEINSKSVSYLLEDPFNFRPGVAYTYTATLNTSTTSIKVDIGCELEDWNGTGGGSGEGGESGEGGSEGDDAVYTDLSAAGTANCYLIQGAGNYKFRSVIGNTDATVGNVKSVEVLWESFGTDEMPNVGDLIASADYKDGYIRFKTPENFRDGNAVIAAKNSKGTILWSWHIWCAEEGWQEQVYYNDAGTMMDRNLGATSATPGDVGALGLIYQWGRKDPFVGSVSAYSSILSKATSMWEVSSQKVDVRVADKNPMAFYSNLQLDLTGVEWKVEKTLRDPCPYGWRVPYGGNNGVWAKAIVGHEDFDYHDINMTEGANLSNIFGEDPMIYYPFVRVFAGSDFSTTIETCSWSSYKSSAASAKYYCFRYLKSGIMCISEDSSTPTLMNANRGCPVRCYKECNH